MAGPWNIGTVERAAIEAILRKAPLFQLLCRDAPKKEDPARCFFTVIREAPKAQFTIVGHTDEPDGGFLAEAVRAYPRTVSVRIIGNNLRPFPEP